MTKRVSKDEALKAVKTITKEISESSLEQEALEAVRTLILWAGDDPEREGLVDTPKRVVKAFTTLFGVSTSPSLSGSSPAQSIRVLTASSASCSRELSEISFVIVFTAFKASSFDTLLVIYVFH